MSQLLTPVGQNIGASASASVHPMNIQGWFSLGLTDSSLGLETEEKGPWLFDSFAILVVLLLFFLKAVKTLNSICLSEGRGWQYRNHRAVVWSQWGDFQMTLGYETKERNNKNLMKAHGLGGSEEKGVGHLAHQQHFFCLRILCSILGLSFLILCMGFSRQEYWSGLQNHLPNHCRWWLQPWNKKTLTPWKKCYDQPRQHSKKQRHYFANKGPASQGYCFSSSYLWMWELDCEENWALKNWCFWTVVLEKTLEHPLDCKEIQPAHPKGDQSWVFIGMPEFEAETPILWPPDVKSWLTWKDPDAGKDWRQKEKGTAEDEMVGWHHWLNGHEFE